MVGFPELSQTWGCSDCAGRFATKRAEVAAEKVSSSDFLLHHVKNCHFLFLLTLLINCRPFQLQKHCDTRRVNYARRLLPSPTSDPPGSRRFPPVLLHQTRFAAYFVPTKSTCFGRGVHTKNTAPRITAVIKLSITIRLILPWCIPIDAFQTHPLVPGKAQLADGICPYAGENG